MTWSHRAPTLLALLLTLPACATGAAGSGTVLEGTLWRIVEVDGQEVEEADDIDITPHFRVISADGMIHGATGCNRFSGRYSATGTKVAFGPFNKNQTPCPDAGRQWVEEHILEVLTNADGYRLEGDWLWIFAGSQHRLTAQVW